MTRDTSDEARISDALSKQLPDGCEIISVKFADSHSSFQPRSATYILPVRQEYLDQKLTDRIRDVLDRDTLVIRRSRGDKDARIKIIDVRGFLSSIEVDRADIIVECGLSAAGSIRLREVLELLELDETKLDSPIRRTNVQWRDV